jgi:hypothetical protein
MGIFQSQTLKSKTFIAGVAGIAKGVWMLLDDDPSNDAAGWLAIIMGVLACCGRDAATKILQKA